MRKIVKLLGIIALVSVIGFSMAACTGSLSGKYVYEDDTYESITFKGKNFTLRYSEIDDEDIEIGTYSVSGSILTLMYEDSPVEHWMIENSRTLIDEYGDYWKKQETSSRTRSGQNSRLAGKWEIESSTNWSSVDSFEFFRDGTGEMEGMSITWKVVEGNRINITAYGQSQTVDYTLSGSKLTLIYDARSGDKAVYRKIN